MHAITYLHFDGNAREAMTCYAQWLGGNLSVSTFGDSPMPVPPEGRDRVIHARITQGDNILLMASDYPPGMPYPGAHGFAVSIACDAPADVDRLCAIFREGGTVSMEPQDTFWNARFAMLTDRFGVSWMFNYEKPVQ